MSLVYPNWLVWLTQNYDIASGPSACVAPILFQEYLGFCTGTLCCPAMIALENNGFMTSQHDYSFNNTYWLCPGLHFELVVGSSRAHQKSVTTGITVLHHDESFSRLKSKLDSTEKHDSNFRNLCIKKADHSKKSGFYFFSIVNGGGGG